MEVPEGKTPKELWELQTKLFPKSWYQQLTGSSSFQGVRQVENEVEGQANGVIRIGEDYQAMIPMLNPKVTKEDACDQLVWSPDWYDDEVFQNQQQELLKKELQQVSSIIPMERKSTDDPPWTWIINLEALEENKEEIAATTLAFWPLFEEKKELPLRYNARVENLLPPEHVIMASYCHLAKQRPESDAGAFWKSFSDYSLKSWTSQELKTYYHYLFQYLSMIKSDAARDSLLFSKISKQMRTKSTAECIHLFYSPKQLMNGPFEELMVHCSTCNRDKSDFVACRLYSICRKAFCKDCCVQYNDQKLFVFFDEDACRTKMESPRSQNRSRRHGKGAYEKALTGIVVCDSCKKGDFSRKISSPIEIFHVLSNQANPKQESPVTIEPKDASEKLHAQDRSDLRKSEVLDKLGNTGIDSSTSLPDRPRSKSPTISRVFIAKGEPTVVSSSVSKPGVSSSFEEDSREFDFEGETKRSFTNKQPITGSSSSVHPTPLAGSQPSDASQGGQQGQILAPGNSTDGDKSLRERHTLASGQSGSSGDDIPIADTAKTLEPKSPIEKKISNEAKTIANQPSSDRQETVSPKAVAKKTNMAPITASTKTHGGLSSSSSPGDHRQEREASERSVQSEGLKRKKDSFFSGPALPRTAKEVKPSTRGPESDSYIAKADMDTHASLPEPSSSKTNPSNIGKLQISKKRTSTSSNTSDSKRNRMLEAPQDVDMEGGELTSLMKLVEDSDKSLISPTEFMKKSKAIVVEQYRRILEHFS